MLWWVLDSEIKLRQVWNEEPTVFDVKDDKVEIIHGTLDYVLRYGNTSSFGHLVGNITDEMFLLYIDFVNKPKVAKNNSAQGVSAFIEYYDFSGNKIKETYGRWIGMPEADEITTHRYNEIPSDGQTKKRLGIALIGLSQKKIFGY